MIGLCATYLLATEFITAKKSKGEILLFRRGHTPATLQQKLGDEEAVVGTMAGVEKTNNTDLSAVIKKQTAIFHWENVCYDIKIKGEPRRILDHVDGWVKPGTLTALMVCCAVLTCNWLTDLLTTFRVFLEPVKPHYSTYWLLAQRWVSSQEVCLWMVRNVMIPFSARLDMFNNKISILLPLLFVRL